MYNNYFNNKTVLVTGGGSGIGRAVCIKLAECGALVTCSDISLEKAEETAKLAPGGNLAARKLDVTTSGDYDAAISAIVKVHGQLDLVFNNAGVAPSGELRDLDIRHFKQVLDINFFGVLNGSQAAYRQMLKQGSGQIVNTASLAGLMPVIPLMAPYCASKHAVVNYTRTLRMEAKSFNIKANVICPGFVETPLIDDAQIVNSKPGWTREAGKDFGPGLPVEKAADFILAGVAANMEIIIFPRVAKLMRLFSKLFPRLYVKLAAKSLGVFREKYRIG